MATSIQLGNNNIMNVDLSEWDGDRHFIQISDGGVVVVRLHQGQRDRTGADEGSCIRITMRFNDMDVELGIFQEMQSYRAYVYTLIRDAFGNHFILSSVLNGSIIIELRSKSDDSVMAFVESLRNGKFLEMLRSIFNRKSVSKLTQGRRIELDIDVEIPDQLIEAQKYAFKIMLEKLQTFLEFDKKERSARIDSCAKMRTVGGEILEKADYLRRRRNIAIGVTGVGAVLALLTIGASLLASGAVAGIAMGTIALGTAMMEILAKSRAQQNAQVAVDKYKEARRGYSQALQQARNASLKHKDEAMRYVDQINDPERRRLLKRYFEDESTVCVSEDFKIRVDTYEVSFLEFILMTFFGHLFNVLKHTANDAARGINSVARQVETFNVLQEAYPSHQETTGQLTEEKLWK